MSIELAPKNNKKIIDLVHNSFNTSPTETKRILNTTSEEANTEYYFEHLIENFSSIKAAWEQQLSEAHAGKILTPIKENAIEVKKIVDFFKSKGGNLEVKPDLSLDAMNVSVTILFAEELSFNEEEIQTLSYIISVTTDFYMEALPRDAGIRIYFVYNEVGKYVDVCKEGE